MLKQSIIIQNSLARAIHRSRKTKKEIAKSIKVSQQSLSDWTSTNRAKPVTIENAQLLTDFFRDSDFTLQVIHEFFGLFKSIDGEIYRRDPSSLEKLQKIESNERKEKQREVEKILLKESSSLTIEDKQQILAYAFEFLDEIMIEVTLINVLCDLTDIDIRKLSEQRLSYWITQGYMKG